VSRREGGAGDRTDARLHEPRHRAHAEQGREGQPHHPRDARDVTGGRQVALDREGTQADHGHERRHAGCGRPEQPGGGAPVRPDGDERRDGQEHRDAETDPEEHPQVGGCRAEPVRPVDAPVDRDVGGE